MNLSEDMMSGVQSECERVLTCDGSVVGAPWATDEAASRLQ